MSKAILTLLATCFIIGCTSTTSTQPAQVAVVRPGVGSVYYVTNTHKDASGSITKTDFVVDSVVQTNITYRGYSDVIVFTSTTNGGSPSIEMFRIDADGDLWTPGDTSISPKAQWYVYPAVSHKNQSYPGTKMMITQDLNINYIGEGSYPINSTTLPIVKLNSTRTITDGTNTDMEIQEIWAAPSIGFFANVPSDIYTSDGVVKDNMSGGLTRFVLK